MGQLFRMLLLVMGVSFIAYAPPPISVLGAAMLAGYVGAAEGRKE